MARLGIMGGTFDPIHVGHLDCARVAQRVLSLHRVLFMPSFCTNFKQGRRIASSEDRLRMCELAIQGEPSWMVSSMEIDRGGITYTVDTLRELHALYPQDKLYFITGSDALQTLDRWMGADELVRLATFVCVERPGFGLAPSRRAQLVAQGFALECIENDGFDVSSSEIRARCAQGESIDDMVPDSVAGYIRGNSLYSANW